MVAVDKVCRRVVIDPAFTAAPREARPPLSDRERKLLLAGNVGAVGRMGASFFLLHQLGRCEVLGLTLPLYAQRIRAEYAPERARWAAAPNGD
jgi:hypothetical protein